MIAFNQTDIFNFSADLQHGGAAFYLKIFHNGNAVAVCQQVAIRVFHDQRIAVLRRLRIVPFMGAFRANEHAIVFIGVFRIAFRAVWKLHVGILKSVNTLENAS